MSVSGRSTRANIHVESQSISSHNQAVLVPGQAGAKYKGHRTLSTTK